MNFADLVIFTGKIEYTLGGCGLAGIDVRNDADISDSPHGFQLHE